MEAVGNGNAQNIKIKRERRYDGGRNDRERKMGDRWREYQSQKHR